MHSSKKFCYPPLSCAVAAGHLSCLSATDLYRYLSQEHDATTVGVLLGMAASKRGSLDPVISKMLFLHVPTRHPVSYPELELSPLVQAAALLGVGLLYQGSCHRYSFVSSASRCCPVGWHAVPKLLSQVQPCFLCCPVGCWPAVLTLPSQAQSCSLSFKLRLCWVLACYTKAPVTGAALVSLVSAAALLAVGLLYQGSQYRCSLVGPLAGSSQLRSHFKSDFWSYITDSDQKSDH